MSTIKDFAEAYLVIRDILSKAIDNPSAPDEDVASATSALEDMERSLVDAWRAGIRLFDPRQAPAPASVPDFAMKDPLDTFDFARFKSLFEKYGVPVTDGIRKWFSDVGGWDKATSDDKAAVYNKALEYYDNRDPNADHDVTRCYACGTKGEKKTSQYGDYYKCPNPECGFQGREGDWVASSWDEDNWEEKRDRLRKGGRQQRTPSRSGGGGYSRGRSGYGRR